MASPRCFAYLSRYLQVVRFVCGFAAAGYVCCLAFGSFYSYVFFGYWHLFEIVDLLVECQKKVKIKFEGLGFLSDPSPIIVYPCH